MLHRAEKLKVESLVKCGCQPWFLGNTVESTTSTRDQVKDQFITSANHENRTKVFSQVENFCSPVATECFTNVSAAVLAEDSGCKTSCTGLYADVQFVENKAWDAQKMDKIIEAYRLYQARFGKDLQFDPGEQSLGKEKLYMKSSSMRIGKYRLMANSS